MCKTKKFIPKCVKEFFAGKIRGTIVIVTCNIDFNWAEKREIFISFCRYFDVSYAKKGWNLSKAPGIEFIC